MLTAGGDGWWLWLRLSIELSSMVSRIPPVWYMLSSWKYFRSPVELRQ